MAVLEINTPAQQQALRRARWQVAILSTGLIIALIAAISGWWMYWQNTVAQHQQGRTSQACRDLVKQREENLTMRHPPFQATRFFEKTWLLILP